MKRFVITFIAFSVFISVNGQLLQGEWRDHLPFHDFYRVVTSNNYVYGISVSGILIYNKSNGNIIKLTKASGIKDFLSDVEISTINYSEHYNLLVIGYANGNLDILHQDGTIINLPDIKNKSIIGTKKINKIEFYDHSAYLACDFGIIKLDIEKMEFAGNYYFGEGGTYIKVKDISINDNILYTATSKGLYWANLINTNLLDYNYWNHIDFVPQNTSEYNFIKSFNSKLYAIYKETSSETDKIITLDNSSYSEKSLITTNKVYDLSTSNGFLTICGDYYCSIFDTNENLYSQLSYGIIQNIFVDADKKIYGAALDSGMFIYSNYSYIPIKWNSPKYYMVSKVETKGDHLWVTSGSPNRPYFLVGSLYHFYNESWSSYTTKDYPSTLGYANTYKVAIDPRNINHVYVCSEAYGLIEFMNGKPISTFDRYNHTLFSAINNDNYGVRIAGMQFDSHNNLWMVLNDLSNFPSLAGQPVFKINADGTWEHPKVNNNLLTSNYRYTDLIVTSNDDIWITVMNKGIAVLRDNGSGTLEEKSFAIKNNQHGLSFSKPFCMNEDHDGNIWVGTTTGPVIYYNPSDVFETSDVSASLVEIPRNDGSNLIDFLLSGETVNDIKTDGGNRKWIATEKSGVFLVSEDGLKTIHNFREDNSPLLSNNVSGLGVMEKTGEVFFATDKGLISYKGIATSGNSSFDDVYVYPNPVRENFQGNITITGLIENTIVKITDISGNLVYETTSLGGQAVWDGNNFDGTKVGTGVYLVFLTTQDGSQSHVTKLLFIH